MKLLGQKGLSLVEISVAGAAAIGLALGGAQLFKSQNSSQKTVEANYEVASLVQQMKNVLNDPINCARSFQGVKPVMDPTTEATVLVELFKKVGPGFEAIYRVGQLQPGKIKVMSYILRKNDASLATDETMLNIVFSRGRSSTREMVDKRIKIVYELDGSGNILTCSAAAISDTDIWQRSTDDPLDIYYNDGRVGVGLVPRISGMTEAFGVARGTHSVAAGFHDGSVNIWSHDNAAQPMLNLMRERGTYLSPTDSVAGDSLGAISFSGKAGGTYPAGALLQGVQTGAGVAGALLMMTNNGSSTLERMRIAADGKVGIGTSSPSQLLSIGAGTGTFNVGNDGDIIVNGGVDNRWALYSEPSTERMTIETDGRVVFPGPIEANTLKLGTTGTACSAAIAGQQRYNPGLTRMEFCDGGSWKPMGHIADACSAGREGQFRFNTVSRAMEFCDGAVWKPLAAGAAKPYIQVSQALRGPMETSLSCPPNHLIRSCGLRDMEDNENEDGVGCYLDLAGNRCIKSQDKSGGSQHDLITLFCYCEPLD